MRQYLMLKTIPIAWQEVYDIFIASMTRLLQLLEIMASTVENGHFVVDMLGLLFTYENWYV